MRSPIPRGLAALSTAIAVAACHDAAELTAPSAESRGHATYCTGVLTGVHEDVIVPENTFCFMAGAIVLGDVTALDSSDVVMRDVEIGGRLDGNGADNINAENVTIGGNVDIKEGRVLIFNFVTVTNGHLQIKKMGDVPNSAIAIEDTQVSGGSLRVENNEVSSLRIRRAAVGDHIHVYHNSGPGPKQVHLNTAGKSIRCLDNDQPFEGGPNQAPKIEGQCF